VPGTPSQQAGEIQHFISHSGRYQWANLTVVDDLDEGRSALVHHISPFRGDHLETSHQVEPYGEEARLTLTQRFPYPAANKLRQTYETNIAAQVSRYKAAIEATNPG
jgi:hypothetical protein